ncbi:MAG: hypothetical protein KDI79_23075 [Anaerolineae bacterium]|nr:hypothetical protein [Anaerolineae bacterium]
MCNHFITLAVSNDRRLILQCEHGTVHLTWDVVTVHLTPAQFYEVGELFTECHSTSFTQVRRQKCLANYIESHNYYQLWLQGVGINLAPVDFQVLADLVSVALTELQRRPADRANKPGDQPAADRFKTVPASPSAPFSLN